MRVNVYSASRMNSFKNRLLIIALVALASSACSGNNENSHTTATTFVSPPPRQVLQAESQTVEANRRQNRTIRSCK